MEEENDSMKKIVTMLLVMMIFLAVPISVRAASTMVTLSGASAKQGEMVYLDVTLSDCKKANTLGITMEYDSSVLKKVAGDCSWERKGTVQDFDVAKDNGVWGVSKKTDLNGKICTLAFRVKADAEIGDTEVSCTVIVKNNSEKIGTYKAKATVSVEGEIINKDQESEQEENIVDSSKDDSNKTEETTGNSSHSHNVNQNQQHSSSDNKNGNVKKPNDSSQKQENTITQNNTNSFDSDETVAETEKNSEKLEIEEHEHTENCSHEQPENNENSYFWIVLFAIIFVVLVCVFIKIKAKKK